MGWRGGVRGQNKVKRPCCACLAEQERWTERETGMLETVVIIYIIELNQVLIMLRYA